MRTLVALSAFFLLAASGCWYQVEKYCPSCTTVDYQQTAVPEVSLGTHTQVVLVHGAFGFGDEWQPVVAELQKEPGFSFFAWTWPGPFRNPPRAARALTVELQALLDQLPPTVDEVVVLAHSAAGLLANFAARQLRVPPGRRVTVALLDPALWPTLAKKEAYRPLPAGVTMTVYIAQEPPASTAKPVRPDPARATDVPHEYVGKVGHNPMVAKVVLPLLSARR